MIYRDNCTLLAEFLQDLCEHGLDALPQAIILLLNAAKRGLPLTIRVIKWP